MILDTKARIIELDGKVADRVRHLVSTTRQSITSFFAELTDETSRGRATDAWINEEVLLHCAAKGISADEFLEKVAKMQKAAEAVKSAEAELKAIRDEVSAAIAAINPPVTPFVAPVNGSPSMTIHQWGPDTLGPAEDRK